MKMSGGAKLEAYLATLIDKATSAKTLRVGFLEGATYPDGTSVAMVAALNNFGTGKMPPRPFFSNMVTAKQGEWGPKVATLLEANGGDAQKTLSQMGEVIKGELQDSITAPGYAPNSMVTNLLKDRFPTRDGMKPDDVWQAFRDAAAGETAPAGEPLVWSGIMLNSVGSEVT